MVAAKFLQATVTYMNVMYAWSHQSRSENPMQVGGYVVSDTRSQLFLVIAQEWPAKPV